MVTLKVFYTAVIVLFFGGMWAISEASGRKHTTNITNIHNNYSVSDSTCAVAGVSGLHQFKQSPKLQGSIAMANCDHSNAVSFGVGQQKGDFLYSIVGSVDDVKDEHIFIGGSFGWTFD